MHTIFNKRNYRQLVKKDKDLQKKILQKIIWTKDIDEAAYCIKFGIETVPICEICGIKCEFKKRKDGTMNYSSGCKKLIKYK